MPRRFAVLALLLSLATPALAQELRHARPRSLDMEHLRLELDVDLKARAIKGSADWKAKALRACDELRLDAVELDVTAVELARGGKALKRVSFVNTGTELVIPAPGLKRGEELSFRITYSASKTKLGLHWFQPSAEDPDVPLQVWSQGESLENRYWIPCVDHPAERQTTEILVRVPKGFQALANGALVETREEAGKTLYHWRQKRSHVIYLVSLVVGRFQIIRETWRGRPVTYWLPLGWKRYAKNSFGNTKRMLDFFSERTGVVYPWEKYAQVIVEQFSHGGMENTSATTLNGYTLHNDRAHLDFSSDGLVAHELAHQWYGDLLTSQDWAHVWLNEGFATYFQALWHEFDKGADDFAYEMYGKSHGALRAKSRPILDRRYPDADSMFDGRAYPKGAWVLHMLRRRLGDDAFFRGIKLYTRRNAERCVETSDLRKALEEASGLSLERFFYDYVETAGHPVFDLRFKWHSKSKLLEVQVKQTQKGDAYELPVVVEARSAEGKAQAHRSFVLNAKEQTLWLPAKSRPGMVRFDPGNGILKELKAHKDQDWWLNQLRSDPDPIGRISAAKALAKRRRDKLTKALVAALAKDSFWAVRAELAQALKSVGGELARNALLKALSDADPRVRSRAAGSLGSYRKDAKVQAALLAIITKGDASYIVEASATRSYGRLAGEAAVPTMLKQLAKPSHRERIAQAALQALAGRKEKSLVQLELFLAKSGPGQPMALRQTALAALGSLGALAATSKEQRGLIVKRLRGCLEQGSLRVKRSALGAVQSMGKGAEGLRSSLDLLAAHSGSDRVRSASKKALEALSKNQKALPEIARLRTELAKLRKAQQASKRRLDQLDAQLRKGPF